MHLFGCISMLRYWSSLRYSTLRTLVLLAADFSSSTCLIHVIHRVNQAEYGIHILVAASQEYVNTYSTCRLLTPIFKLVGQEWVAG